ncbi:hypothetical protein [Pseudemcibacter aquimaris]|uniref:hypothetical protein n=1 Tax=Pseudemcibacter aquimaris TaxID=2857064 RepID=UPI002010DB30|nr:hypothetical protein [Pseudemcibacter aquimaris]MCC3860081.1 hypothetical protein [Pseudemcibacter aquimaris]WDU57410.1 hypothetical protein KW060_09385 [Pseudemcibacter aquimaris]
MSNKLLKIGIPFLLVIGAIVLNIANNPLRRSSDELRSEILLSTPIGTNVESVKEYILDRAARGQIQSWGSDLYSIRDSVHYEIEETLNNDEVHFILRTYLGSYHAPIFSEYVVVDWHFNEASDCTFIKVWKFKDAL